MPLTDAKSWGMLRDWPLPHRHEHDPKSDPPRWCTRMEHNLIREDGWNEESGSRIVFEYRPFLYLKLIDGGLLARPGCIDKIWHVHMDLADDGDNQLRVPDGRVVHHQAGVSDADRNTNYGRCLTLYHREFGTLAPGDIWPAADYFRNRTRRTVNARRMGRAGTVAVALTLAITLLDQKGAFTSVPGLTDGVPAGFGIVFAVLGFALWGGAFLTSPRWLPEPEKLQVASCG